MEVSRKQNALTVKVKPHSSWNINKNLSWEMHDENIWSSDINPGIIYDKNVSSILNKLEKEGREQAFAAWLNPKI